MSDDRVVTLKTRRPGPAPRLVATLIFPNDQLRLPMERNAGGPVWVVEPIETLIGDNEEPTLVYPRFGMIDHSPDGTSGRVIRDEHGVSAELYFERDIFLTLQSAAFSSMPLTLFVTFGAAEGEAPTVMLGIERRNG